MSIKWQLGCVPIQKAPMEKNAFRLAKEKLKYKINCNVVLWYFAVRPQIKDKKPLLLSAIRQSSRWSSVSPCLEVLRKKKSTCKQNDNILLLLFFRVSFALYLYLPIIILFMKRRYCLSMLFCIKINTNYRKNCYCILLCNCKKYWKMNSIACQNALCVMSSTFLVLIKLFGF